MGTLNFEEYGTYARRIKHQARSKARNVTEKEYMSGNLLNEEVLAVDVGKAFLSLALAKKTTN